jgi:hypothetical protein
MNRTLILSLCLLAIAPCARAAVDCKALDAKANDAGDRIPGYAAGRTVIGKGRLPFYSAPDLRCPMKGVFVIPGDSLIAYVEYGGFTAVMFVNLKTGDDALGWVESPRLKSNGTGISPRQ